MENKESIVFKLPQRCGYPLDLSPETPVTCEELAMRWPVVNISGMMKSLKNYLKINNIRGYVFAEKVLNVNSCYLSVLLNLSADITWEKMTSKQQVCLARISYWMSKRATYGNNPHSAANSSKQRRGRKKGRKAAVGVSGDEERAPRKGRRKPRSLLEVLSRKEDKEDSQDDSDDGQVTLDKVMMTGGDHQMMEDEVRGFFGADAEDLLDQVEEDSNVDQIIELDAPYGLENIGFQVFENVDLENVVVEQDCLAGMEMIEEVTVSVVQHQDLVNLEGISFVLDFYPDSL